MWSAVNGKLAKPLVLQGLGKILISDWRGAYVMLDFIRAGFSRSGRGETFLTAERYRQTTKNVKVYLVYLKLLPGPENGLKTIRKQLQQIQGGTKRSSVYLGKSCITSRLDYFTYVKLQKSGTSCVKMLENVPYFCNIT